MAVERGARLFSERTREVVEESRIAKVKTRQESRNQKSGLR